MARSVATLMHFASDFAYYLYEHVHLLCLAFTLTFWWLQNATSLGILTSVDFSRYIGISWMDRFSHVICVRVDQLLKLGMVIPSLILDPYDRLLVQGTNGSWSTHFTYIYISYVLGSKLPFFPCNRRWSRMVINSIARVYLPIIRIPYYIKVGWPSQLQGV